MLFLSKKAEIDTEFRGEELRLKSEELNNTADNSANKQLPDSNNN